MLNGTKSSVKNDKRTRFSAKVDYVLTSRELQTHQLESVHLSSRTCNPEREGFLDSILGEVSLLVKRCQMHECRPSCKKYGDKCRYNFPRKTVTRTHCEQGFIELERDNEQVNCYNPWLLAAVRSNCDVQFLTSGKSGVASIFYTTNYFTKTFQSVWTWICQLACLFC